MVRLAILSFSSEKGCVFVSRQFPVNRGRGCNVCLLSVLCETPLFIAGPVYPDIPSERSDPKDLSGPRFFLSQSDWLARVRFFALRFLVFDFAQESSHTSFCRFGLVLFSALELILSHRLTEIVHIVSTDNQPSTRHRGTNDYTPLNVLTNCWYFSGSHVRTDG